MNKIIWTERALVNLQAIRDYIAQFNPYIIRYRINDETIVILRVRHMARSPS